MLHVFFDAEPWALPVAVAIVTLATFVSPALAQRLGGTALVWWIYLSASGGFVAATLTPTGGSFDLGISTHPIRSMAPSLPSLRMMHSINEVSLNVLVGVPLGFGALMLAFRLKSLWPMAVAVLLPFFAELTQGALPGLNRVGFVLGDAITNLIGVSIGVGGALGLSLMAGLARRGRPPHVSSDPPVEQSKT